jgi:5-formyltetrahydrofolate cyclo-ligase
MMDKIEGPIPMTRHDVALDYIATPQEVIAT